MWRYLGSKLDLVLVSEYPKCGATWFCNMLHELVELPFPRNSFPPLESCVMQGHHMYNARFNKIIGVIRDGRDVMVSAYYYYLFDNEHHSLRYLFENKLNFEDYNDVEKNLPIFIEHMFTQYDQRRSGFTWSEAINSFYDHSSKVHIVKYENLLVNPLIELKAALNFLGFESRSNEHILSVIEKYSFKTLTNRKQGVEAKNTFLRKGVSGDWKNKFTKEACEVFNHYGGKELIRAGYEKNDNWVNSYDN